ncbi:MAG TPA: pyridoxal 5'-phosphate synthase glutaminase subunit PdxT, partial [Nocardioides sp.]|nr:pyridoxal 5'-phosphate synthase glutaminase subunit PdxT [Nocardioides sp.]
GDVSEHAQVLADLGGDPVEVRTVDDLAAVDKLILPGGESTTMSKLLESSGMFDAVADRLREGMPAFGTCAGMILLSKVVLDGRPDQRSFAVLDIEVRRNAFGRQVDSFEADLEVDGMGRVPAVFIRAPYVERVGDDVEVLARVDDHPVLCRQGHILAAAFHPELSGDLRLHELFLREVN